MKSSNIYASTIVFFVFLTALLPTSGAARAQNVQPLTAQQWLEDLDYVTTTMLNEHPDINYRITREQFDRTVDRAAQTIKNSQSDEECVVAIRRVVACIRDGHTALGMGNFQGNNRLFPVRLYEFADGIFITGIAEQYAEYVGERVIEIGRVSAVEAFKRAGEIASADNDYSRKNQAPMIVARCLLARGLGIVESADELPLVVETKSGKKAEFVLQAVTLTGANNLATGMDIGPVGVPFVSASGTKAEVLPLYLKHQQSNRNYWFEHVKAHKAIYMQYNLILDQADESFTDFYRRMFTYIDDYAGSIDKFVLDLRFNNGGNGLTTIPFINEIIKRDNINRLGRFYTIIGRRSFSAAVLLVAEMMIHTNMLMVGEPAGAAENMLSDMVLGGILPNSGAQLFLSSAYINIAWPAGKNYTIPPHYPAPLYSSDFFSGRDPAVDAIFAGKVKAVGMVLNESGPETALKYFKEIVFDWSVHTDEPRVTAFTFPISAKYNGEIGINTQGYNLMGKNKLDEARALFELNANLFPNSFNAWDSYGECLMKIGDIPNAIKSYEKSLELNPDNQNAVDTIRRLKNS
jgi:tetratricopeptide (TPR) repeat protein